MNGRTLASKTREYYIHAAQEPKTRFKKKEPWYSGELFEFFGIPLSLIVVSSDSQTKCFELEFVFRRVLSRFGGLVLRVESD